MRDKQTKELVSVKYIERGEKGEEKLVFSSLLLMSFSSLLFSQSKQSVRVCNHWQPQATTLSNGGNLYELVQEMETNSNQIENVREEEEEEEEFILLDLDSVCGQIDIPPNAPYVLSGLDTLNPVLVIGDKLRLIGEYEESIGTCFIFTESDGAPLVHEETGPSEENLFTGKCFVDPKQASSKQIKPIARLQKILKFRLLPADSQAVIA